MFRVQCSGFRKNRDGQAITELMVGLVAVLALLAALVQIVTISKRHTDAMVTARKIAGQLAMQDGQPVSGADYLEDWEEGGDGKRYTKDDEPVEDDPSDFDSFIVEKAAQGAAGWDILNTAEYDDIPDLRNNPTPADVFGLVEGTADGTADDTVELLPVFKHLIYNADAIEIEVSAWQTLTTGIY